MLVPSSLGAFMPIDMKIQPTQIGAGDPYDVEGSPGKLVDITFIDQGFTNMMVTVTVGLDEFINMLQQIKAKTSGIAVPPKKQIVLPG